MPHALQRSGEKSMRWSSGSASVDNRAGFQRRNGMNRTVLRASLSVTALAAAFGAGVLVSAPRYDIQASAITSRQQAKREDFEWGTLYTYYAGESYGTEDG